MTSSACFLRNSFPWISVLASCLACAVFLGYGFLSILITSLGLILSTLLFKFSTHKPVEKSVQEESLSEENSTPLVPKQPHIASVVQEKQEAQENGVNQIEEFLAITSPDLYSESGSNDQSSTSEDSDWPDSGNACQSPDCSDGSISDEESLIEIALPSGHYVSPKEEDLKLKLPNYSREAIFAQNELMELLAEINEMNEEENLIEIDISMGLIKCSRFGIEA
ncbi:hypothetical protein LguiB_029900 [Lonicera macranthoides]